MAQKFSSLDEAAQQLGISKDRLSQLREAGKVRGYRDGASWKFRSEDIERLVAEGVPTLDPPSDIDLGSGLNLDSDLSLDLSDSGVSMPTEPSGIDLSGAVDEKLPAPGASDVNLEIDEPTVPALAGEDDSDEVLAIDKDDELLDLSDSILLSENELGATGNRPPSTIIGKAELDPDLDLALQSSSSAPVQSDVRLATTSDVLAGSDDDALELEPSSSDNFQGLAEVDVDLEAESSRILTAGESEKAKDALRGAAKAVPAADSSELELATSSSITVQPGSDVGLDSGVSEGKGSSLTGLSALDLEDDEDVLGEGSDITLSSESSGINIISPSDSGLALDEVALSSASMSSPLDLGAGDEEVDLEPLELSDDDMEGEEPFQLTPLGEAEDEEKDSSQVIALDEVSEEESAGVVFQPSGGEVGVMGEDFGAVGLSPGAVPVAATADDTAISGVVFALLSCSLVLLLVCGMMMFDLVRNVWSWNEVTPVNSALMDVLTPML